MTDRLATDPPAEHSPARHSPPEADPASRADFLLALMRRVAGVRDPVELIQTFAGGLRAAYGSNAAAYLSTVGLPAGQYRVMRFQAADGTDVIPAAQPDERAGTLVRRGGLLGAITAAGRPFLGDPAAFADATDLAPLFGGFRVMVATPIATATWWIDWIILFDADPAALTRDSLEDLLLHANLVGAVVENMRVAQQLAAANAVIERELAEVARIQRALLPDGAPRVPGLEVASSYETAVQAGGDLYEFVPLADGRWAIVVADASGHGPAAAVVAAMVSTMVRDYLLCPDDGPAGLLRHANAHLCARRIEASFVTAFAAIYDPPTRQLVYARAGHNPPLLSDGTGPPRELWGAGGLPLGIDPDARYAEQSVGLEPGQVLLLYTDGVTDAGPSVDAPYGTDGLARALCQGDHTSAAAIVGQVRADLVRVQGGQPRRDDQTVIAIRVEHGPTGA